MKLNLKITSVLTSTLIAFFASAAPMKDTKFHFNGSEKKHPVTLEMEKVVYKAKAVEITFKVYNNSDTGIDFSQAAWDIHSGNRDGFIKKSDFDGLRLQPKSKRLAQIIFAFDEFSKPTFLQERENGTSTIKIENVKTFTNKKLPGIVLKNY